VVDLSSAYDLSRTGEYIVTFRSPLQHASLSDGSQLKQANGLPMLAQSASLRLWVDGTDQLGANKGADNTAGKGKPGTGGTIVNGVTYKGCSTTQISGAGDAVVSARAYSENAKGYSTPARWVRAIRPGSAPTPRLVTALLNSTSSISMPPSTRAAGRSRSTAAATRTTTPTFYPTRPYEIFVCRAFWTAPRTGTDSRAGTLIHE
jgi:peptidyl-Lys metalloendopeptidase